MAQAAHDGASPASGELDTSLLGILGDALADAGCNDSDILDHCRQAGKHVKGCWIVGLILGDSEGCIRSVKARKRRT